MPENIRAQEQIINILYEINYYVSLLYMVPCAYSRDAILNMIRDRLFSLSTMINQLNPAGNIAGTGTTNMAALPGSTNILQSSSPGSNQSGIKQLTQGIQPSSLQNVVNTPVQTNQSNQATFTVEQLSGYTGKNGAPAYVAVNEVVYDVTNNAAWAAATHFGLVAGRDLTQEFASCHAGANILQKLRVVGRLI